MRWHITIAATVGAKSNANSKGASLLTTSDTAALDACRVNPS
jgi:hypothetical protein